MKLYANWKRIVSLVLSLVLLGGIVLQGLPQGVFVSTSAASRVEYGVTKEDLATALPVISQPMRDANGFMNRFIYTDSSESLNLNKYFKRTIANNVSGAAETLSRATMQRDGKNSWRVEYQWTLSAAQADLMRNCYVNASANLSGTYHKGPLKGTTIVHTNNLWGRSNAEIYVDDSRALDWWFNVSNTAQSGTSVSKSDTIWSEFDAGTTIRYTAYHTGCNNCGGGSKVSGSTFWLEELTGPSLSSVYMTSDSAGTQVISGSNFSGSTRTVYMVLEFTENIRFASHEAEDVILNVDAWYNDSTGRSVDDSIVYGQLVSLDDNKMIFQVDIPSTINNEPTNIYISGVSGTQTFTEKTFKLKVFKMDGTANTAVNNAYDMRTTQITDLAGNSINWRAKSINNVYFDNVAPTVTGLEMTGSMIGDHSTVSPESWDDIPELDRSDLFAGVGDTISYRLFFSEIVAGFDTSKVKAVLNLKDANNDPIKLSVKKNWGSNLVFQDLTITADMLKTDNYGVNIRIVGFEGLENVTDAWGNPLDQNELDRAPAQQIFLDVNAPSIDTMLDDPNADGIYIPQAYDDSLYMTIPLKAMEDLSVADSLSNVSQINGTTAYFALVLPGQALGYQYQISTSATYSSNIGWKYATTADSLENTGNYKLSFQPVDGEILYLHIRLNGNLDYNYTQTMEALRGIYFYGSVWLQASDHAGNPVNTTFDIQHQVDTKAPTVSVHTPNKYNNAMQVDFSSQTASMRFPVELRDDFSVKRATYTWIYTDGAGNVTETTGEISFDSSSRVMKYTDKLAYSFAFDAADNTTRSGSVTLRVVLEDYAGYTASATATYDFDFTSAVPSYSVVTGNAESPLLMPELSVFPPYHPGSDTGSTLVLFPVESYYLAYIVDENDPVSTTDVIADLADGVIADEFAGRWVMLSGSSVEYNGSIRENIALKYVSTLSTDSDMALLKEKIYDVYAQTYGTATFYVLTTTSLPSSFYYNVEFVINTISDPVEIITAHLANGAEFDAESTGVQDAMGNDVADLLNYNGSQPPATDLDNVVLSFHLWNASDLDAGTNYGLQLGDYEKSVVNLLYRPNSYQNWDVVYTWSLLEAAEQSVVIPAGVCTESGWYSFSITMYNANGEEQTIYLNHDLYMDSVVLDLDLDKYHKEYIYTDPADPESTDTITVRDETITDAVQIDFGMHMNGGENWTASNYLTIIRQSRTDTQTYTGGLQENLLIRVYNAQDENWAANALWVDVTGYGKESLTYVPVLVESFSAESYGTADALQLPLVAGDNRIVYELKNTNGVVVSHEVIITAHTEAPEFNIGAEYVYSDRTGCIMQVTVFPRVKDTVDLTTSIFSEVNGYYGVSETAYTYVDDFDELYCLVDRYGNLSSNAYAQADIDGEAPYFVGVVHDPYSSSEYLDFNIQAGDHEGFISAEEMTLTFDADYSALLMGLTGEERQNNTQQITINLPINREKDENGEYLPWEVYASDSIYGIYYTRILSETYEEGYGYHVLVQIKGALKYDQESYENGTNTPERVFTLTATDANGNTATGWYSKDFSSQPIYLSPATLMEDGTLDPYTMISPEGYVGVYSTVPFARIDGYADTGIQEVEWTWGGGTYFFTYLPGIQKDGVYELEVVDLFGDVHTCQLDVNVFSTLPVEVVFSETEPTRNDVTVHAAAVIEGAYITSIIGTTADGKVIIGTINPDDPSQATIVMPENGMVEILTSQMDEYNENYLGRTVAVTNIDRVLENITVSYLDYAYSPLLEDVTAVENAVYAVVHCTEWIYATNGELEHIFPIGSKAGDSYVFTVSDAAGNTATVTAVLPVDVTGVLPEVDTQAPDVLVNVYGTKYGKTELYLSQPITDAAQDAVEINLNLEVPAQSYRLSLVVTDTADTKIFVVAAGSAAPSYSDAAGSTVEGVALTANQIGITQNAVFDLYVIDESGNATVIPGITVSGIRDTVVELYPQYTVEERDDETVVIVDFIPVEDNEQTEPIFAISPDASEKVVFLTIYDEAQSKDVQIPVRRYYYTYREDGTYTFTYQDAWGNYGQVETQMNGFNTTASVVRAIQWLGTTRNLPPEHSSLVNRDVTASITMSKPVTGVKLYFYDETNPSGNYVGAPATDIPVLVTFTGDKVYLTYSGNVNQKLVAEFASAESSKLGYYVIPEVNCIDKTGPVISLVSTNVAQDRKSVTFTFTADKRAMLQEGYPAQFTVAGAEFTWTATKLAATQLHFVDEAGNITVYTVTEEMLSGLDLVSLTADFSLTEDGANASGDPSSDLPVEVGGSLYVKLNKTASAELDGKTFTIEAGIWTKLTLSDEAGLHILMLTDTNTGERYFKILAAQPKDEVRPVITLDSNNILLNEGVSVEEMLEAVRAGVSVKDNVDGVITEFTVTGYPADAAAGLYVLTYTTCDAAGNSTTIERTLYIAPEGTPLITINGIAAMPYGTTVVSSGEMVLTINGLDSEDSLLIKYKAGIKTTGQMKIGSTEVEDLTFSLTEEGFYTIYIRTPDRVELVTYLYVEG